MKFRIISFENTPENAREILTNLGKNIDVVAGIFDETTLDLRHCAGLQRKQNRERQPGQRGEAFYLPVPVLFLADIWRERDVWYQGRSRQQVETGCFGIPIFADLQIILHEIGLVCKKFF